MNSRNGISKQFRFHIIDNNNVETVLEFSFKHRSLRYFMDEKYCSAQLVDGSIKQKFLYAHHYFEIDWAELITGEDADKLASVINAERLGYRLLLEPHTDVPSLRYEVVQLKDDDGLTEKMEFSQIINHRNSAGNKGVLRNYRTKHPHYGWEIVDPSLQQGVSTIGMEEFS